MKTYCNRKTLLSLFLIFALLFSFSYTVSADTGFRYQHDPCDNASAMQDIVRDEHAVYGFRPSETGSLKMYADLDWSDPEIVAAGRSDRIAYHESISSMYAMLQEMQSDGRSTEEIARALSTRRNEIRLESYADDPEGLAALKERNLEQYGHEEGPLPDELYVNTVPGRRSLKNLSVPIWVWTPVSVYMTITISSTSPSEKQAQT